MVRNEVSTLLFLVDVDNLFHAAKGSYGPDARVDFLTLKQRVLSQDTYTRVICKAYATSPADDLTQKPFHAMLQRFGYDICISPSVFYGKGPGGGINRTNIDVPLAVDAITQKFDNGDRPTTVFIASGDSDLLPVYRHLNNTGCQIGVVSFPRSLSSEVRACVHTVILLDHTCLFVREEHYSAIK